MGHWYTKEGEPQHFIIGANGKERGTTLRDARKLDLVPSVTGIIDVLDKPGLNNWFQNKILYACLTVPRPEGISDNEFIKIVRQDASQEAEEAKLRGNVIHNCIEDMWNEKTGEEMDYEPDVMAIASSAIADICNYCGESDFIPEKTVAGDGYGGAIDLHNDRFLIDWKTKDIDDVSKKMAYPNHAMQLAAYDVALGFDTDSQRPASWFGQADGGRRCINVFIDRTEPGKVVIHEWEPEEIALAWQKFQLLLRYWQLDKGYMV